MNRTHRLLNDDYTPHLNYVEPPSDPYQDIPISPNSKFFPVLQSFDLILLDDRELLMEFERLNLFHVKHGSIFENIWSNDRLDGVKKYKVRKFMKTEFFEYILTRRGREYVRSQTNFVFTTPKKYFSQLGCFSSRLKNIQR